MNLRPMMVVAKKEFTDGFRDRRAIGNVLLSAFLGPLMISLLFSQLAKESRAAQEIKVPVVGAEHAPLLVRWLGQQSGVEVVAGPADPEAAVRDQKAEMVLVIGKDYAEKFAESRPAPVQVLTDSSREVVGAKVRRLMTLLRSYSAETGGLRLLARGVSPSLVSALKVEEVNVADSQQRAATRLQVLLVFLVMATLTTGMQIATDSTAGERERGSLEPLLLNPVPRWQLAGGKWLAASGAAFIGLVLTLVVLSKVMGRLSLEELGVRFHLGVPQMVLLAAAIGPMALLAPAVLIYVSTFAKSFKEAQSYTALLVASVAIPGVLPTFFPSINKPWMQPVPVVGQYALGAEILGGKVPSPLVLVAAALGALVLAGILVWMTSRLFESEKIVLGR